ncbi:GTP cyclohydrolase I FolE [Leucobacter allii]|uniref:GTP cyclohydrolase 1 n=1 Tax=Leucobacter allii TaxID=2932247 RepID=A0ABY4FMA3_9MICO|nr:GTP cyclohydrolase I FolE [Leucobacter allii]UOQ57404.1 GTP cyclohydrolase I FolE [Leucobacter allii]
MHPGPTTAPGGAGSATPAPREVDRPRAMRAVAEFLAAMGEDPERSELRRTPERVTELAVGLFAQAGADLGSALGTPMAITDAESLGQLVVVSEIPFRSLCPHHLLPFEGTVDVTYAPDRRLAGFSRVVRLVEAASQRLQLQERMGEQIAQTLMTVLEPHGVRVRIEASHGCVTMLEHGAASVRMMTTCSRGTLADPESPGSGSGSDADLSGPRAQA